MTPADETWNLVFRALAALAICPDGLKGMTIRARVGPARQHLEEVLKSLTGPVRRIHPEITDFQLYGGLDFAATLASGRAVHDGGIIAAPSLLVMPMAERIQPALAARLSMLLDADRGHRLILIDEGADPDERAPSCLRERLAFDLDLEGLRTDCQQSVPPADGLERARHGYRAVKLGEDDADRLTGVAAHFGIDSLRIPAFALRTACALAALDGRATTTEQDLREAIELVYPARATQLPDLDEQPSEAPPEAPEDRPEQETRDDADGQGASDALIEAVRACLPSGVLDGLTQPGGNRKRLSGSGAGQRSKANRRGRPLPSRPGRPDGNRRIDVIATLRAAAPWQTIRGLHGDGKRHVSIYPCDIHLRRYQDRSDRLVIFVVDASGSAALTRLCEAKGAVELLLAQAYARRDQVALAAFRGSSAEVLLQPTRSLVQAKRRLAALPGGGGTPLAAGLQEGLKVALRARNQGLSPALVILTDGRANVALDGGGGRHQAMLDAEQISKRFKAQDIPGLLIDISPRRTGETAPLAHNLGATYLSLPRADASGISRAVNATFGD